MNSFSLSKVCKDFGSVEVLRDVSLSFEPGTVTAIVGDNGAGKSTLLKTLAGSHLPDSGNVLLGDVDLSSASAQVHRDAGIEMVYQDLALAPRQDVTTNLFIGRELSRFGGVLRRRTMRQKAEEILSKLAIRIPDLSLPVGRLSGGQQQAIAIARAILFHPRVLLLDEPTAALAAREVEKTLELIKHQRSEGRIVVLVSHRLNDVLAVADRVVVLKHGEVYSDEPARGLTLETIVQHIVS